MEWMLMAWKKYADFSGRARRKEYWMFQLGLFIAYVAIMIVTAILGSISESLASVGGIIYVIFALAAIVPALSAGVRRLHDQDKSGWFMLMGLVPIANIVLLVFMFLEGTKGPNQYGPDPKGGVGSDTFN